ncbi:MAG: ABC transporter permease subunit [Pseudomonadota bacterium]
MAFYDGLFNTLGLREWCDQDAGTGLLSMSQLLSQNNSGGGEGGPVFPFPSLDNLHESCAQIFQTRDFTAWIEDSFLAARPALKAVLDPMTQPLSSLLDGALWLFTTTHWAVLIAVLLAVTWLVSRSWKPVALVAGTCFFLAFIDHFEAAMETLSIIVVCTGISILIGVPTGIAMSKSDRFQRTMIPILDLLQTMPTFVYLIPLIFLFSITESKIYGIAVIVYAIVPVIRLTDLGIRLVDKDVVEAANAFGMNGLQKLLKVELPLALPNIMAGVNQTIMMSLAMVVIASMISAPGLGVNVLQGIRSSDIGVGIIAGLGIVLLAVVLDRTSKAALARVDKAGAKKGRR